MNTRQLSATVAPESKLLVSVEEAALLLSLGRSHVYELVQRGDIITLKLGRSRRVPVSALQAFIARQLQEQDA
jgi:excisionase family DNA binding protein